MKRKTPIKPHTLTPERLKAWREELGMSQDEAARVLDMDRKNYQQHERGIAWATGKPVKISRRTALACAAIRLGIDPE